MRRSMFVSLALLAACHDAAGPDTSTTYRLASYAGAPLPFVQADSARLVRASVTLGADRAIAEEMVYDFGDPALVVGHVILHGGGTYSIDADTLRGVWRNGAVTAWAFDDSTITRVRQGATLVYRRQ